MGKVTWQDNSLLTYDEWLLKRIHTIGASEVAAIVVGNKYTSNLEIFYQKIGAPTRRIENLRMFIGKETEELSSKFWKYYSGTEQSIVDNIRKNNQIKDCVDLKATAFNSDYPQLSVTPDRKILPVLMYADQGEGALEIKNSQTMVLNSHKSGIPTDNIYQIITQMMVTTWKYGELFYFLDNRTVTSFFLKRKDFKKYEETIQLTTADFWKRVLLARPLYNQLYVARKEYNMRLAAELEKEIANLEPPPQATTAYLEFLDERYKDKIAGTGVLRGGEVDLIKARKLKDLKNKISKIEAEQTRIEIDLKKSLGNNYKLDFGRGGFVSWYPNKNDKRIFKNNII